jgi:hypothetical protein
LLAALVAGALGPRRALLAAGGAEGGVDSIVLVVVALQRVRVGRVLSLARQSGGGGGPGQAPISTATGENHERKRGQLTRRCGAGQSRGGSMGRGSAKQVSV